MFENWEISWLQWRRGERDRRPDFYRFFQGSRIFFLWKSAFQILYKQRFFKKRPCLLLSRFPPSNFPQSPWENEIAYSSFLWGNEKAPLSLEATQACSLFPQRQRPHCSISRAHLQRGKSISCFVKAYIVFVLECLCISKRSGVLTNVNGALFRVDEVLSRYGYKREG